MRLRSAGPPIHTTMAAPPPPPAPFNPADFRKQFPTAWFSGEEPLAERTVALSRLDTNLRFHRQDNASADASAFLRAATCMLSGPALLAAQEALLSASPPTTVEELLTSLRTQFFPPQHEERAVDSLLLAKQAPGEELVAFALRFNVLTAAVESADHLSPRVATRLFIHSLYSTPLRNFLLRLSTPPPTTQAALSHALAFQASPSATPNTTPAASLHALTPAIPRLAPRSKPRIDPAQFASSMALRHGISAEEARRRLDAGVCVRCGLSGHQARHCRQDKPTAGSPPAATTTAQTN